MAMQKTKLEIIDETVAYYGEDPSRKGKSANGGCVYLSEDGKMCAVGRCMKKYPYIKDIEGGANDMQNMHDPDKKYELEKLLKVAYQGLPENFWMRLQNLHDNNDYWTKTGFSIEGLAEIEYLKKEFAN